MTSMKKLLTFAFMIFLSFSSIAEDAKIKSVSPLVNGNGKISFPTGFDQTMTFLGSWFVPDGGASGFHQVFTTPTSIKTFKDTGQFADGTVLVKELRHSKVGNYTTGTGISYATSEIKQWFVMVKDSKNRFVDNPAWGDGWGWALFKPDDTTKNLVTNYKTDCLGCHIPAKDKDWIYTEAYPILKN
jgi:hypothetical protein